MTYEFHCIMHDADPAGNPGTCSYTRKHMRAEVRPICQQTHAQSYKVDFHLAKLMELSQVLVDFHLVQHLQPYPDSLQKNYISRQKFLTIQSPNTTTNVRIAV